ncbi:RodZ family helix-turn-helix domain-containing protein [Nocardioides sp.]|uniref:helix-turn-helix domain-containing protein n=1 Tax=Nocardioides sp. TaxID=35761 RepID=UPI00271AE84C|nr:helix-turn-helix transcriptional regulator [Nocardioides sp.]MDO9456553.1 helix-turn-helix transcriptional regulator [Nocardioides sp.]
MSTDASDPTDHDTAPLVGTDVEDAPFEDTYDDTVQVRRDGPLSLLVGVTGAAVSVAYLLRAATGDGSLFDWAVCLLTGLIGLLHLAAVVDARAPLMVIDHQGVRVRRGRVWHGVAWPDVDRVEHRPRTSLLHDGSLSVVDLEGRVLSVRLSLSVQLTGSDWHELGDALLDLSEGRTTVVQPGPDVEAPGLADGPEPARELVAGRRQEVLLDKVVRADAGDAADDDTSVVLLPTVTTSDPSATSTIVIHADDLPSTPADPVIGPLLVAARQRVGLSVDQLAERTRIRPHVIESIELDDFGPCGGDFYARGHLRTLGRILGVDADPLVASYDERYAGAPIDPRRVFEAELSTGAGGAIRGTRGRLNWPVLVAAVMAVVLVWSVARLVMDGPVPVSDQVVLNGSPGGRAQLSGATTRVPVSFTAATGGARVIVRDGRSRVVFDEDLAFNQTAELDVVPPVRINSTDGGLLVAFDGEDAAALGSSGQDAARVYVP